jgi:hypothetical protein
LTVEEPVGQRRESEDNRWFDREAILLNGIGAGNRRREFSHFFAACLEGEVANQRCQRAFTEPPTVIG